MNIFMKCLRNCIRYDCKRYVRKADNGKPEKKCSVPHHGVAHPANPGKVSIVFDCSA